MNEARRHLDRRRRQGICRQGSSSSFRTTVSTQPPPSRSARRSGRNEAWLKIKTIQKGKFPVVGFVKDLSGVAALYLGKKEGKDLVYLGKVGTGWSRTVSSQIRKQLDTVVSPKSKLTKPVRKPKATWVEPTFVADVEYRDITSEGLLRASSFKGLFRK
jgi:bifunctional non-homologous end joining protein LigD